MPLPPIDTQLTNFAQIEILRHQIEEFEEELKKTETRIRDVQYEIEKQRFLMTIHQVFQHAPIIADANTLPELYNTRETLHSALETMRAVLANLEASSGPVPPRPAQPQQRAPMPTRSAGIAPPQVAQSYQQGGPNPANPGLRRNRFDAF